MKRSVIKFLFLVAVVVFTTAQADAQARRRGAARTTVDTTTQANTQAAQTGTPGTPADTVPKPPQNIYAGMTFEYDTLVADLTPQKSQRPDNAYDKSALTLRKPLPYEHLRYDDAMYAEKVWRELDLREKLNKTFVYESTEDNGSQIFASFLMRAVMAGEVEAFNDDRFTSKLSVDGIKQMLYGVFDTLPKYDVKQMDKVVGYVVSRRPFDPKDITKIRLKEEWVFDRESSRMFVRILGVGLYKAKYVDTPKGKKEIGTSPLFWVYYPDIRPILVKAEVYNPKNMGQNRMTWEELFESRMFSSYVVKSTLDNPQGQFIRNYIKDPILQLLEGENIKEKIFNFEQDLWSY